MRICIIAEGSYPYVIGGVSNWAQMLISWLSEHQFIICTIGARERNRRKFNYRMPDNVIGVKEVFLDGAFTNKGRWGVRLGIGELERKALLQLLIGQAPDWSVLFSFFRSSRCRSVQEYLMSRDFLDIVGEAYRVKYSHIPFIDFYWALRSMTAPLVYIIKQEVPEADLYHSVSAGYAGMLGSLGKALYGKPYILTEHGIYTREREEEIIKAGWIKGCFKDIWIQYFHCLSRCSYIHADKVITLFQRNKDIEMELGCEETKIDIIPNGIHTGHYHNLLQKDVTDDCINVGAVVRIVPIKDIKTMIQGFAIAKQQYEKIKFYIMGPYDEDGDYYKECRQMVSSLALNDVIFTGKINVSDYIGKMDILVLSSISEGQPLAVLEGMASGKPFVTTDVGSCRELLYGDGDNYGDAGIVVPVMAAERIGQAILKLCKDKELRTRMGNNAMKRVSSLYSKDKLIAAYQKIYNDYGRTKHYGRNRF